MKHFKYFFILQNLCANITVDDYEDSSASLVFEREFNNDDDFFDIDNYENIDMEEKIVKFLQENDEIKALLQMKVAELNPFLRMFFDRFFNGFLKVNLNLLNDEVSIPFGLKLSNIIKSLQINNVAHNDVLNILDANGSEVGLIACSKIKSGIKYTYLNRFLSLIESHACNLSLEESENLHFTLGVADLRNDLELLSRKGIKDINLSLDELNKFLYIEKNSPKKKYVIDKDWYNMFDITASITPSYGLNGGGVYCSNNFSATVDLFNIIQYSMKYRDKKLFKACEKTYRGIKKDNEIRGLMYLMNLSHEKLKNLDAERRILANYKTSAGLKAYLQCEKEYYNELIKYSEYILDIKNSKSEIGYYIYEVIKNAK